MNISEIQRAASRHRKALMAAKSVKELADLSEEFTLKSFNKMFRGNLEKTRKFLIERSYTGEENSIQSVLFDYECSDEA